jgi:hypothetical protein
MSSTSFTRLLGVALAVAMIPAAHAQVSEGHVYPVPMMNGAPVDACASWGTDCGKPAADQFCRTQGWQAATDFTSVLDSRTWVIGSNRYCQAGPGTCGGLRNVTCVRNYGAAPAQQQGGGADFAPGRAVFDRPQVNGIALDWCVSWARDCGDAAAQSFCRSQGYARSIGYLTYTPGRTIVPASRQICEGSICGGMLRIDCHGQAGAPQVASVTQPPPPPPPQSAPPLQPQAAAPPPPAPPQSAIGTRMNALKGRLSNDDYARLYGDLSVTIARYGQSVGWINGIDNRLGDPGRGVSDFNAHYGHSLRNNGALVAELIVERLTTLQSALAPAAFAALTAEVSGLLAQRGG